MIRADLYIQGRRILWKPDRVLRPDNDWPR